MSKFNTKKFYDIDAWVRVHKIFFFANYVWPNKLECLSLAAFPAYKHNAGLKGLPGTNTLACWTHLQVTKKKTFCVSTNEPHKL